MEKDRSSSAHIQLSDEALAYIVEAFARHMPDPINTPERQLYYAAMRAARDANMIDTAHENAYEMMQREDTFHEVLEHIPFTQPKDITSIKERMLLSELFVIYDLFVKGKFAGVYVPYCKRHGHIDTHKTRLTFLQGYLEHIHKKNREYDRMNYHVATIGIEDEYITPLARWLYAIYQYEDNIPGDIRKRDGYKRLREIVHGIKREQKHALAKLLLLEGEPGFAHDRIVSISEEIDLNREIISTPAGSYKSFIRELSTLGIEPLLHADLNIHVTLGDVLLSLDHYEVMEILPMLIAAGIYNPIDPNLDIEGKSVFLKDGKYPKQSKIGMQEYFFPLHRTRYKGDNRLQSYLFEVTSGVELRGFHFSKNQFTNLVRSLSFIHCAGSAIKCFQMLESERDKQAQNLAEAWGGFYEKWQELLRSVNIDPLKATDTYIPIPVFLEPDKLLDFMRNAFLPYHGYLGKVLTHAVKSKAFQEQAFYIMTEFNAHVKKILSYSS